MAITLQEVKEKLTKEELNSVELAEKRIDDFITKHFDGISIKINPNDLPYTWNSNKNIYGKTRLELIENELLSRYKKMGWNIVKESDCYVFSEQKY